MSRKDKKQKQQKREKERVRDDWDDDNTLPIVTRGFGFAPPHISPTPDPARVAAALAAISTVSLGLPESFTTPVTFVVAKNGIFRVQKAAIGSMVSKVDGLPTVVDVITPGFHPSIPKIPFRILNQVVSFFKAVCHKAGRPVESYCQVWYATSGDGAWLVRVPEQRVSGASVHHDADFQPTENLLHVADIHSHGSMDAFFSTVDDTDERRQGVRIFGVIGHVDRAKVTMKWRLGKGDGTFMDIPPTAVIEDHQMSLQVSSLDVLAGATVNTTSIVPWTEMEIPDSMLAKVDTSSGHTVYQPTYHQPSGNEWERVPGGGYVRRARANQSEDREVASDPKTFPSHSVIQSSQGTFVVEKNRIRHFPLKGD